MAIPRNLVYVFACIILFAFLGMVYIVYTEKNLSSFMSHEISIKEDLVVHPLFQHFKNILNPIDEVPRATVDTLTPKKFYQEYLTNNLPVLVTDGCKAWPATEKWTNKEYLKKEFAG